MTLQYDDYGRPIKKKKSSVKKATPTHDVAVQLPPPTQPSTDSSIKVIDAMDLSQNSKKRKQPAKPAVPSQRSPQHTPSSNVESHPSPITIPGLYSESQSDADSPAKLPEIAPKAPAKSKRKNGAIATTPMPSKQLQTPVITEKPSLPASKSSFSLTKSSPSIHPPSQLHRHLSQLHSDSDSSSSSSTTSLVDRHHTSSSSNNLATTPSVSTSSPNLSTNILNHTSRSSAHLFSATSNSSQEIILSSGSDFSFSDDDDERVIVQNTHASSAAQAFRSTPSTTIPRVNKNSILSPILPTPLANKSQSLLKSQPVVKPLLQPPPPMSRRSTEIKPPTPQQQKMTKPANKYHFSSSSPSEEFDSSEEEDEEHISSEDNDNVNDEDDDDNDDDDDELIEIKAQVKRLQDKAKQIKLLKSKKHDSTSHSKSSSSSGSSSSSSSSDDEEFQNLLNKASGLKSHDGERQNASVSNMKSTLFGDSINKPVTSSSKSSSAQQQQPKLTAQKKHTMRLDSSTSSESENDTVMSQQQRQISRLSNSIPIESKYSSPLTKQEIILIDMIQSCNDVDDSSISQQSKNQALRHHDTTSRFAKVINSDVPLDILPPMPVEEISLHSALGTIIPSQSMLASSLHTDDLPRSELGLDNTTQHNHVDHPSSSTKRPKNHNMNIMMRYCARNNVILSNALLCWLNARATASNRHFFQLIASFSLGIAQSQLSSHQTQMLCPAALLHKQVAIFRQLAQLTPLVNSPAGKRSILSAQSRPPRSLNHLPHNALQSIQQLCLGPQFRSIQHHIRDDIRSYERGQGLEQYPSVLPQIIDDRLPSFARLNSSRFAGKTPGSIFTAPIKEKRIVFNALRKNTPTEDINGVIPPFYTLVPTKTTKQSSPAQPDQHSDRESFNHHLLSTAGQRWRMRYTRDPGFTLHADHVLHNFIPPEEWNISQ